MPADLSTELRSAILRGNPVDTELGTFSVRTYPRYEGGNPHDAESVVVPAKHLLFLSPADTFHADVLDHARPLRLPDRSQLTAHHSYVSVVEDYLELVSQLRRTTITQVPDPYAWSDVEPAQPVRWRDLGHLAVFQGPDYDDKVRTTIVFRQSASLAAALAAALGS